MPFSPPRRGTPKPVAPARRARSAIGTLNFTSTDIDSHPAATVNMTTITTAAVVPIMAIALETAETTRNRVAQDSSADRPGTTWGLGIE